MFENIIEKINQGKRILITAHKNPDGDAVGACLALFLAINKINDSKEKVVRFILEDKVPSFWSFYHIVL